MAVQQSARPAFRSTQGALRRRRMRLSEVSWLCSQLATTQGAGMPIYRSLSMLASQRSGSIVGERLAELQEALNEGRSLAEAMRARLDEYTPLVVALVAAGESSGALESALRRCADMLAERLRLRRKVRTAMLYPLTVLAITMILVAVMLLVVVPRFQQIYDQTGGELPALTQFVIALSAQAGWFVAGVGVLVAGLLLVLRQARTDPRMRARVDAVRMRVPLLGRLARQAADARVAGTLASLLSAGVSLLEALEHAAASAGSAAHAAALMEARERLGEGSTLSAALGRTGQFPELMVQLVAVGEESGALASLLERYAQAAAQQVDETASSLTTLIEPAIMVVVGGVVGVFLLALYLPIISIGQNIK